MKRFVSIILILVMSFTMVSYVTSANYSGTDELTSSGDKLFYDDFTMFDTSPLCIAQSGWLLKEERKTSLGVVPACIEATISKPYIDYSDKSFGGNTIGVLISFDDNWLTQRLGRFYQIPDVWSAWDYACEYSGVTFYAGTSADDLEEIAIERAAFIRPEQGEWIAAELLTQLPEGTTYFKVAFTNADWEVKICRINVYEGKVADVEATYTEPTYYDYPTDLVFATATPSPTPRPPAVVYPCATVDPESVDPETGIGIIIYDNFENLDITCSYNNYKVVEDFVSVNAIPFENYIEPEEDTDFSDIMYRGTFGRATVSFITFFDDRLINEIIPTLYPDAADPWSAYEEVMEYANYKVYAGESPSKMTEITANPDNVEYIFEKPSEKDAFGVMVNVKGIPDNSEYIKIELNMPENSQMAKVADLAIWGPGILNNFLPLPHNTPGDTNKDGSIDINDAVLLVEYIGAMSSGGTLDSTKFPNGTFPNGELCAKLTYDDVIDVNDVVLLIEYIGVKASGGTLDSTRFPNGTFPGAQ